MEAKFLASIFSFLSIFLAIYAEELDFLVPNYDNANLKLKSFEIRQPLVLSCNVTRGDFELTWKKNNTEVSQIKSLAGRYQILNDEKKFVIHRTDEFDDGLYSCEANNTKKEFNVLARVIVRVPPNTAAIEGNPVTITCTVKGTDPQLHWIIGKLTINTTTDRYILLKSEHNVENAVLRIENVSLDDQQKYICVGRNDANLDKKIPEAQDESLVRVKGKFAAVWPFIGICVEVLILCTIILIYEKRRNKTELEESDTDPQEQ